MNYELHGWIQLAAGAVIAVFTIGPFLKSPSMVNVGFLAMALGSGLRAIAYFNRVPEQFEPWTTLLSLAGALAALGALRQLNRARQDHNQSPPGPGAHDAF